MQRELIGVTSKQDKSGPVCLSDCTEMPTVVIKVEPDTEDAFVSQEHRAPMGSDVIKNDYTEMPTVVIKVEPDAEDTFVTQEHRAPMGSDVIKKEDDFVMKREDEADEVMVKQELEIEPTVLQSQPALRTPSPVVQTALDPHPSTSSGVGRASTPLCTVLYAPAKLRTEAEDDYYQGGSGFLSRAGLMLGSNRKQDFCQEVSKKCSYDHFGSEVTSMDRQTKGRSRSCIESPSDRYPKKDKTGACTGCKQYECHSCKYIAKKKSHLTNQTHKHLSQKLHKCEQCDYSSSHVGHLKAHMRTHTGEKPYKCEQCEYSASQVSHLKLHMRTHTGEKPYKCEQCEYSASEVGHLKKHMRTHTGERPYKCEQCEYSASQIGNLKKHVRTHTGERPYKCEQCEYSASQIGHLRKHMRTHTGERPYKYEQ